MKTKSRLNPLRLVLSLLWAASVVTTLGASAELAARRPNIILILTDDQGYGDLACHGNPIIQTPNIDRLHGESVRFTDFHVSPTCAPTRSALLSGKHEFRNGVTHTILERERMSLKTTTYAQILKTSGYATGIFGKWHLGDEPERWPDKRGFDEMFIHGAGGIGQSYPGSCGDAPGNRYFDPAILHNGQFVKTKGYCTDVFFAEAIRWIEQRKGRGPFYCHISPNAPHAPLDVPEKYEKMFADKVPPAVAKFYGMIFNIDENVGRLVAKLAEWGIERDTLVIFMTDNGGTAGVRTYNAGMRAQKGTPYNGGTRVPSFWRWPGTLTPGNVNQLTAHLDYFPTLAELAGAKLPAEVASKLEGRSLVPLLRDHEAPWADRVLFTHVGRWERGQAANSKYRNGSVRSPRFNMVSAGAGAKKWELFDLKADAGETKDVIGQYPDVARELESAFDRWWDSILPGLENENLDGPSANPFHVHFWKQFPSEMIFPNPNWQEASPESQGVNTAKLQEAVEFLKVNSGRNGVSELLFIRNGYLIWKGTNIDHRHGVWSCTKSFTSTVLGLLVDDGKCSVETRAKDILPEMAANYPDVTLRHFTTMTSGYRAVGDEPSGSYTHGPSNTPFQPNPTPLFSPPGSRYAYWDSAMNQFGHVLTKIAGEPLESLFERRIASPIGMNRKQWDWGDYATVEGVVVNGGSGNGNKHIFITAREMARLGHLFLNDGKWRGQQLISSEWIKAATSVQVPSERPLGHEASGIDGRGAYGFNWWVNGVRPDGQRQWPGAPVGAYGASGHNNNRMFVVPEWKMVIVRLGLDQSDLRMSDAIWSSFLSKVREALPPAN